MISNFFLKEIIKEHQFIKKFKVAVQAQSIVCPSKFPVWFNSTDMGSNQERF